MNSEALTKRITQYSAAAGALLLTGNAAQAQQIKYGTIEGGDGNTKLTYTADYVMIDLNSDKVYDFTAFLVKSSFVDFSESYTGNFAIIYGGELSFSSASNIGAPPTGRRTINLVATEGSGPRASKSVLTNDGNPPLKEPTPEDILVKKFLINDLIGSDDFSSNAFPIAIIGDISIKNKLAPNDPFDSTDGDEGYLGLALDDGAGNLTYDWAHVEVGPDVEWVDFSNSGSQFLPNSPIPAGLGDTVPVAPWATAAGLGLVGLLAYYRKRKSLLTNV